MAEGCSAWKYLQMAQRSLWSSGKVGGVRAQTIEFAARKVNDGEKTFVSCLLCFVYISFYFISTTCQLLRFV